MISPWQRVWGCGGSTIRKPYDMTVGNPCWFLLPPLTAHTMPSHADGSGDARVPGTCLFGSRSLCNTASRHKASCGPPQPTKSTSRASTPRRRPFTHLPLFTVCSCGPDMKLSLLMFTLHLSCVFTDNPPVYCRPWLCWTGCHRFRFDQRN